MAKPNDNPTDPPAADREPVYEVDAPLNVPWLVGYPEHDGDAR